MDRALNLALLGGALDGIGNLPTPAELRRMLADAEVEAFFAGDHAFDSEVVETAWTLHQVGTVRPQLELYTQEQQVQANAVAAHIFDLALRNGDLDLGARLVITFRRPGELRPRRQDTERHRAVASPAPCRCGLERRTRADVT